MWHNSWKPNQRNILELKTKIIDICKDYPSNTCQPKVSCILPLVCMSTYFQNFKNLI